MPRTLSKSDFKLARTCEAKLYFRENGYPDNTASNPYLAVLRNGGYMVEALAKTRYPNAIALEYGRDVEADFARTMEHLRADSVTLCEATLLSERRQARVDILDKRGNTVRLIEVKAKSFNSAEHAASLAEGKHGMFRAKRKPFGILSDWSKYIDDVAFQTLILEKVLPGVTITPVLAFVDTSKIAAIDDIPTFFELVFTRDANGNERLQTARYIGSPEQIASLDLVTEIDVSAEVAIIRDEIEQVAATLEARLDAPLEVHLLGLERGSKCALCEFRTDGAARNGFADCWGELAHARPHLVELFKAGSAKAPDKTPLIEWGWNNRVVAVSELPVDGLVKADGTIGPDATRQRRQIEHTKNNSVYIGDDLARKVASLKGPLHFIDFETSRLALPYHRGMRPYGVVTFQWSAHQLTTLGARPAHSEWLNNEVIWPNQLFAESLRAAIGDTGPVITWSPFEEVTLNQIVRDLAAFGRDVPDLVQWLESVSDRIVDLHEWARDDYYHPGMGGRTGIKYVLDALWRADPVMRRQFEEWTGLTASELLDPYRALPALDIDGTDISVREGTAAMIAYQEMMYGRGRHDPAVRAQWSQLLRQYCHLDTLSMVLILEHWRRATS